MPEFIYREDGGAGVVRDKGWTLELGADSAGAMRLDLEGGLSVGTAPVAFGSLEEATGIASRPRIHNSLDGEETGVEMRSSIPFGHEPSVSRKLRILGGRMHVQCDLQMRASHLIDMEIDAGAVRFSGGISNVAVMPFPKSGCDFAAPDWREFKAGAVYESDEPPASIIVEGASGSLLEFLVGEDPWRWMNASKLGGRSLFTVSADESGIEFSRKLFVPPEATDGWQAQPGRNWRTSWLMAWSASGKPKKSKVGRARKSKHRDVFDMKSFDWPDAAKASRNGELSGSPCLCSPAALNCLKRWLRGLLSDASEGDTFALLNVEPHVCDAASHLDRPKMSGLLHWDMSAMLDFQRWANRQLSNCGASLDLSLSDDAASLGLPSLSGKC